ncbi:hypothetical protein HGM15179_016516 [Zosterops borbonicus]|uniref:Uncharacterized protein n=1 Tax=Zosterops borbonicus TaxID=364589 RepID=A0A8K1LE83_9PASS|nr:hypothetical protein HGM15179_016516 [Zosterops borbonicus]
MLSSLLLALAGPLKTRRSKPTGGSWNDSDVPAGQGQDVPAGQGQYGARVAETLMAVQKKRWQQDRAGPAPAGQGESLYVENNHLKISSFEVKEYVDNLELIILSTILLHYLYWKLTLGPPPWSEKTCSVTSASESNSLTDQQKMSGRMGQGDAVREIMVRRLLRHLKDSGVWGGGGYAEMASLEGILEGTVSPKTEDMKLLEPEEATEMLPGLEPLCSGARLGELGVFTCTREGFRETSEPLTGPKGAPGELERDLGQGTGNGFPLPEGRVRWDVGKEYPGFEGEEALVQISQRSCGCPWISGSVPGQVGWGLEQPGIVEGVPAHGRGWNGTIFKVLSNPNETVLGFCDRQQPCVTGPCTPPGTNITGRSDDPALV